MFKEPFNFALQRTQLQAIGFYLFFLLVSMLIGFIAGSIWATITHAQTMQEGVIAGRQVGMYLAPILPIALGGAVFLTRPLDAVNVIITLVGFALALFFGWLGGGITVAYVTTRPARANNGPSQAEA